MYARLLLGAWRGVEAEAMELINAGLESAHAREAWWRWPATPTAVLNNGLGRYEAAVDGAKRGSDEGD